jgi:hypothetical protein
LKFSNGSNVKNVLTVERRRTVVQTALVVAALMLAGGATGVAGAVPSDPVPQVPCYNGIAPLDPYVDNCGLQPRPPRVMGSAPDQTAILNCSVGGRVWRAVCLSQFVNGR